MGHAAWAVPVITAVAAAPAMAASCSAHNISTALNIRWQGWNLDNGDVGLDTYFDITVRPSTTAGRNAWQMHADVALSHTLLTYSASAEFPYQVAWDPSPTGWTRSVVATTAPDRWTYTWTAGSPVLPRTMLATTPLSSTSATAARSLQLPDFTGVVSNTRVRAWRPLGTQMSGNPWTYETAYTSTYQFNAGSGCSAGIRTYNRTGSITLQHMG